MDTESRHRLLSLLLMLLLQFDLTSCAAIDNQSAQSSSEVALSSANDSTENSPDQTSINPEKHDIIITTSAEKDVQGSSSGPEIPDETSVPTEDSSSKELSTETVPASNSTEVSSSSSSSISSIGTTTSDHTTTPSASSKGSTESVLVTILSIMSSFSLLRM